ncbi:uncharacterized protein LOC131844072 [Achroia grisella]|uniref:uncharacterized protein LOC131844072 n=1 Tax=Achroia grisella TaxID=688607 RepID=UPI0027D2C8CB|nr:uncharacterized protein LOC131844072 [Achroia grisella]
MSNTTSTSRSRQRRTRERHFALTISDNDQRIQVVLLQRSNSHLDEKSAEGLTVKVRVPRLPRLPRRRPRPGRQRRARSQPAGSRLRRGLHTRYVSPASPASPAAVRGLAASDARAASQLAAGCGGASTPGTCPPPPPPPPPPPSAAWPPATRAQPACWQPAAAGPPHQVRVPRLPRLPRRRPRPGRQRRARSQPAGSRLRRGLHTRYVSPAAPAAVRGLAASDARAASLLAAGCGGASTPGTCPPPPPPPPPPSAAGPPATRAQPAAGSRLRRGLHTRYVSPASPASPAAVRGLAASDARAASLLAAGCGGASTPGTCPPPPPPPPPPSAAWPPATRAQPACWQPAAAGPPHQVRVPRLPRLPRRRPRPGRQRRARSQPAGSRLRRGLHTRYVSPASPASPAAVRGLAASDARAASLLAAGCGGASTPETIVSRQTVGEIISMLNEALASSDKERAVRATNLATHILRVLPDADYPQYEDLMLNLFRLELEGVHEEQEEEERKEEERGGADAWRRGLTALRTRTPTARRACALLHRHVFRSTDKLDIPKIEHATSLCPYLVCDGGPSELTGLIFDFPPPPQTTDRPTTALELFALRYDCIVGKLNCPFDDDNEHIKQIVAESSQADVEELTVEDFIYNATKILFRSIYLRTMLLHTASIGDDDDDDDTPEDTCSTLLNDDYLRTEFMKVLRDYVIIESLYEGYAFWPYYELIQETKSKLDAILGEIIQETPISLRNKILVELTVLAAKEGYYWSYARRFYDVKTKELAKSSEIEESDGENATMNIDNLTEVVTGNGFCHSLQANSRGAGAEEEGAEGAALSTAHVVMMRSVRAAERLAPADLGQPGPTDPGPVIDLYYDRNHIMLYDRDISDAPWARVVSNAAIAEYLALLVAERGWDMPAHHWDFTTITLCSLYASLDLSKKNWGSAKVGRVCSIAPL